MSSRDKILKDIKNNQPPFKELPEMTGGAAGNQVEKEAASQPGERADPAGKFMEVLSAIGGTAFIVKDSTRIIQILREQYPEARRIVSNYPGAVAEQLSGTEDPHTLENIDLAVLPAHFGVAENGSCWITEDQMVERALPFICQQLALVIEKKNIAGTMHEAYERIAKLESGGLSYGFATFIAGPSKTADIEQSLVLGAHGPKSLTVFLVDGEISDAGFY